MVDTNDLVRRCLEGDESAFEQLLDCYKDRIFSFILRLVQNQADAEDIAQTVFVKAFRNLQSYDQSRPFISWLFRIAHNCCIDFLRSKKEHVSIDDEDHPIDIEDMSISTENVVARNFEQREAEALLASLPPLYREVLMLQYREDMGCSEIAVALGIPEGTAKARLFRARAALLEKMKPEKVVPRTL